MRREQVAVGCALNNFSPHRPIPNQPTPTPKVDTAMVGRLGTTPLAALGSNGALFNCMFFLFFTALAVICTQAMAQAHARGDRAGVGRGFVQALVAMAAVSCGLVAALRAAPEAVLGERLCGVVVVGCISEGGGVR
jgi:hypothetical protein